jgi:hypothetical protein
MFKNTAIVAMQREINNRHIALLALLLQGGASRFVDLEDIAVMAYHLAPTRFRWNKYDYPSLEITRLAFKHWKELKTEESRFTSRRYTYLLTEPGIRDAVLTACALADKSFVGPSEAIDFFESTVLGGKKAVDEKRAVASGARTTVRPSQSELRRIKSHKLYKLWLRGESSSELWEIADLLNCLPDSTPRLWEERFTQLNAMAVFWQDEELSRFLSELRTRVLEKV